MRVTGTVAGIQVVLNVNQLATYIDNLARDREIDQGNLSQCATAIMDHNGRTSGGGCPHHIRYQQRTVFHESHGQLGGDDGCTVFFAPTQAVAQGGDAQAACAILAVGYHHDTTRGHARYYIDWIDAAWVGIAVGNYITF